MEQALKELKEYIKQFNPVELLSVYTSRRASQIEYYEQNNPNYEEEPELSPLNLEILHYVILTIDYDMELPFSELSSSRYNKIDKLLNIVNFFPVINNIKKPTKAQRKSKKFRLSLLKNTDKVFNDKYMFQNVEQNTEILKNIKTDELLKFDISLLTTFIFKLDNVIDKKRNSKEMKKNLYDHKNSFKLFIFDVKKLKNLFHKKTTNDEINSIFNLLSYELGDLKDKEYSTENQRLVRLKPFIKLSDSEYMIPNWDVFKYAFDDIIVNILQSHEELYNQYLHNRSVYLKNKITKLFSNHFSRGKTTSNVKYEFNGEQNKIDFDINLYNKHIIIDSYANKLNEKHKQGKDFITNYKNILAESTNKTSEYEQYLRSKNEQGLDIFHLTILLDYVPDNIINHEDTGKNKENFVISLSDFEIVCDILKQDIFILDFLHKVIAINQDMDKILCWLGLYIIQQGNLNLAQLALDNPTISVVFRTLHYDSSIESSYLKVKNISENSKSKPRMENTNDFILFARKIYNQDKFNGVTKTLIGKYGKQKFNTLYNNIKDNIKNYKHKKMSSSIICKPLGIMFIFYFDEPGIKKVLSHMLTYPPSSGLDLVFFNSNTKTNAVDKPIIKIEDAYIIHNLK